MEWETVIGLEIHAELNTRSKLFSRAPNRFGDEPNCNISEVCTGQPGALPVLNKEAVKKAVLFGCAIGAEVAKFSKFDRKSYFYPDSPRNFQITQYDQPIVQGGRVTTEIEGEEKSFSINRAHLEDDAGMLKHFSTFAGVDYNRAGVPLIEIVSEPCMHSAKEAVAYAMAVKAILEYIDVSDCNMEEGSLRMDANISVRPKGETALRTKTEIKNMNSFSNMKLAIEAEVTRQIKAYENAPDADPNTVITQATYRFDLDRRETILMRRKECDDDYRYFPEPDLLPIILEDSYIEEMRASLPELPFAREKRYQKELLLPFESAFLLANNKSLADYFEEALKSCPHPRKLSNWLLTEFAGRLKEKGQSLLSLNISASHIANLVNMIEEGTITGKIAKRVADDMIENPTKDSREIVAENPAYQPLADDSAVLPLVEKVLAENQQSIADYHAGKQRAFGFLVGQVMKLSQGKASPALVNQLLKQAIEKNK